MSGLRLPAARTLPQVESCRQVVFSGSVSGVPQLVADLYQAGFAAEAWRVFERILWWPEHLAVYSQGIANDDYTSRFPQSKPFGGRISAGRTNEISGCVGVEAIVHGLARTAHCGSLKRKARLSSTRPPARVAPGV